VLWFVYFIQLVLVSQTDAVIMTASLIRKVIPSDEELLALIKKVKQEYTQYSLCRVYIEVKSRRRDWSIGEERVEAVMKKYNMLQNRKPKIPDIPQIDKDHYVAFFTDDKEEVPVIKDTGKFEMSKVAPPSPKKESNKKQPVQQAPSSPTKEKGKSAKVKKSEAKDAKDNKPPEDPFPFVRLVAAKVQLEEQMKLQEELMKQNPNNPHTALFTADEIEQTFTISNMPENTRQEFERAKRQYTKDMMMEGPSIFAEHNISMFDTVTSMGFPVIHRRKDGSVHFIPGKPPN